MQPDFATGVRDLLGPLVLEGSPPERELLARARELRRIIAPEGEAPDLAAGTGKTFGQLLLDDLTGEDDASLAAHAYQVAAPAIAATARALAATAAEPPVRELTARVGADSITLRPDGPAPDSIAPVERKIAASGRIERGSRAAAYVLLGTGALGLLLGLVQPGLAVLGLLLAGIGGALLVTRIRADREAARLADERVADRLAELRARVGKLSEELKAYVDGAPERAATAASDLEAITLTSTKV